MNLDRLGVVCHSNKCILELLLLGSKIVIKACFMKTYVKLPYKKRYVSYIFVRCTMLGPPTAAIGIHQ